uniref:Uncharacterized protein n=1 Tax=Anguilla anguilla TaxID=7936 RepID=A0A0E9Q6G4_ANGAN
MLAFSYISMCRKIIERSMQINKDHCKDTRHGPFRETVHKLPNSPSVTWMDPDARAQHGQPTVTLGQTKIERGVISPATSYSV